MNTSQALWWRQAWADFDLLLELRRLGQHESHVLHYLQMSTEKLAKAYFWRTGIAPPKNHTGFERFLRAVFTRGSDVLERLAEDLGFKRLRDFEKWVKDCRPLALAVQSLAPMEAKDGPNPEYPWPHDAPTDWPGGHSFELWRSLTQTGRGRRFFRFVHKLIEGFDQFA